MNVFSESKCVHWFHWMCDCMCACVIQCIQRILSSVSIHRIQSTQCIQ